MSDIKAVFKDLDDNEHDTRAQAKKANRIIMAFNDIEGCDLHHVTMGVAAMDPDVISGAGRLIEYARSIVAVYGMKDKAPKTEEAK